VVAARTRRLARVARWLAAACVACILAGVSTANADVFVLLNGDRITGKAYMRGTQFVRVETDFGKLRIPLARIDRIVASNGKVEQINKPSGQRRASGPQTPLTLEIKGTVFWYAWPRSDEEPVDPTLRLVVSIDDTEIATYTDPILNPGQLESAIVNSFSFRDDETTVSASNGATASPPDVTPGQIQLHIQIPNELSGERMLRMTYQLNHGSADTPDFQTVVTGAAIMRMEAGRALTFDVEQDSGRLEYSGVLGKFKRKMKHVDTFSVELRKAVKSRR
jgi:hypothetical protein